MQDAIRYISQELGPDGFIYLGVAGFGILFFWNCYRHQPKTTRPAGYRAELERNYYDGGGC